MIRSPTDQRWLDIRTIDRPLQSNRVIRRPFVVSSSLLANIARSIALIRSFSAVISVSSSPAPVITIAPRAALNRSEIRFSSSPKTIRSPLRTVSMSRADSPSRQINSLEYPSNGHEKPFHITMGSPATARESSVSPSLHMFGRTGSVWVLIDYLTRLGHVFSFFLVFASDR